MKYWFYIKVSRGKKRMRKREKGMRGKRGKMKDRRGGRTGKGEEPGGVEEGGEAITQMEQV